MKIFIDHYPDQDDFAKKLANRIKGLSDKIKVICFADIRENAEPFERLDEEFIKKSDIIIPIITSEYLTVDPIFSTDKILSETLSNTSKIIFPFLYSNANWSSISWIVKSKVFPSSDEVFIQLDENRKVQVINELVNTIENIISENILERKVKPEYLKEGKKYTNQIFISHSHSDADFAELLKLHLEKEEINCWVDSERLKIGQDWREEIDSGISSSKAVIAIMSPEARKSEYVTYEWAYAWGKGIKIFPIMLIQTSLHPRLESLQYLDFTNRVTRPYVELVNRIKEIITSPSNE